MAYRSDLKYWAILLICILVVAYAVIETTPAPPSGLNEEAAVEKLGTF